MALDQQHSLRERQKAALSGPASRGYSVASIFEHAAVLTEAQQQALDVISASCGQRPLPKQVTDGVATPSAGSLPTPASPISHTSTELPSFVGTSFEEVVLQNSSDFYRWLAELESARSNQTEEKFRQYGAVLQAHLDASDELLAKIQELLSLFERLKQQHTTVSTRTAALHTTCERLVSEREALVGMAEAIRGKLTYFDELDKVAKQFSAASVNLNGGDLLPLLQKLDDCIGYVSAHPQYADAGSYATRFRQLQSRALAAVRTKTQQALRSACLQAQAAAQRQGSAGAGGAGPSQLPVASAREGGAAPSGAGQGGAGAHPAGDAANGGPAAEGAEAALLYVRFRAAAEPALKGLLNGVEQRAQRSAEYGRLLTDCQQLYCEARVSVMRGPVAARMSRYAAQPLQSVLRGGVAYLMQICSMEHSLFEHFFPFSASSPSSLAPLLDPLCTLLYDVLRPALVQLSDIDMLCQLVDILKVEVLEEQLGRRGEAVAPLEPTLYRILADVQERLTYRAQTYIREEVVGFVPKPADLDYPQRLKDAADEVEAAATAGADDEAKAAQDGTDAAAAAEPETAATEALYRTWYPPVQRTLLLLSKLYQAVDAKIFSGLAQEVVAAATLSVQSAARTITKNSGVMDGQLFAIKQLLVLREQIAPFESDFSVVERGLDFSHMRDYLRRTLSGQLPLFALSNENAMVQLVAPRVRESSLDSKKDLERQLKSTCESFIMHVTKQVVEPMLSFITKVTAVKVAQQGAEAAKPLREQAFASPERVAEVVSSVRRALSELLPVSVQSMRLYLPHPATRGILFKPIKSNIAEAHGQIAALMESEYTPDEVAAIGLTPPQELAALLDDLS